MKNLTCFIGLIFLFLGAMAQNASFTASVSKNTVTVGENFRYTLTLTNLEANIERPLLNDFVIVQGPSTQTNYQNFNGRISQEYSHTYTLKAKKEGRFTLPPAYAQTQDNRVKTQSIDITVAKGRPIQSQANSDFFTTVSINKRKVYLGEPLVATFKIFSRYRNLRDANISYPALEGFWSETVESDADWSIEVVNGRQFRTLVTKYEVLFPQNTGDLTITPFEITALCSDGFFDRGKKLNAKSKPLKVEVLPIPKHDEEGFLGSFDRLSLSVEVNKTELSSNEAINLTVKFSGKGNIKLIGPPEFVIPGDFETYEPKVVDKIAIRASGESGSRKFEYIFIPRSAGKYTIPEIKLQYYDTKLGRMKTLSIDAQNFDISKGNHDGGVSYTFDPKTDVNVLNQGIRYIKTQTIWQSNNQRFFGSTPYYLSLGGTLAFFIILLIWKRKREEEATHADLHKQKKAGKIAKKQLSKAKNLCNSGQEILFYQEIHMALTAYLSSKFKISMADMSGEKITDILINKVDKDVANRANSILELCEQARYAPITGVGEEDLFKKTTLLIDQIEKLAK